MLETFENKPNQTPTDSVLCLALDVGEGLLKNGDSVHHVEDTIKRICRAYGGAYVETFVISSLMLGSVRMADGSYSSQIRCVYSNTNNMSKLEDFNSLSRRICRETPDFVTAQNWLKETKLKKAYPLPITLAGHALVGLSFAIFFGGSILDGIATGIVGLMIALLSCIKLGDINALARTLIVSFLSGLFAYTTVLIGIGENVDMIMIGSIMLLVPGLAFGNALRDLLCGDILTGVLKTVQSCLTAILIACGYSGAMLIMANTSVTSGLPAIEHSFVINLLVAILGTVAFAAFFSVRPSCLIITAVSGGAVYAVYYLAEYLGAHVFVASLLCAVFGAAYSEISARIFKVPAIVFLTPALVSIIPGGSLYYTMSALVNKNQEMLLVKGAQTIYISTGLVTGTIIVTILVKIITDVLKKQKIKGSGNV